jgi:gas vesicle protein
VDHWQTLITGGVSLVVGIIAFVVALITATRQVNAARQATKEQVDAVQRAADQQVAAVQSQIEDLRDERQETDRRRLSVIEWAVRAEGRRLGRAASARLDAMPGTPEGRLPAGPHPSRLPPEKLVIESSPLLRGELEGMALLDDPTRAGLELLASTLHEYNAHIETQPVSDQTRGGVVITEQTLGLLRRINRQATTLY